MKRGHYLAGKSTLNKHLQSLEVMELDIQIHYWGAIPEHYNTLLHKHSYFECCLIIEGEGSYIENGQVYTLRKHTVFLSRPERFHQITSKRGLFIVYIGFELQGTTSAALKLIEELDSISNIVVGFDKDSSSSEKIWNSLFSHAMMINGSEDKSLLNHIASSLIISLFRTFLPFSSIKSEKEGTREESPILRQIILFIRDNIEKSFTLADLASSFNISTRHLSRLFVSELGMNYSDYVRSYRIRRAGQLLKETKLSIKQVAEETGFPNVYYFTRVFTSVIGSSPALFRSLYVSEKTTTYDKDKIEK